MSAIVSPHAHTAPSDPCPDIHTLHEAYRSGALRPSELLERLADAIDDADPAIFIDRIDREHLRRRAGELEARPDALDRLPLFGVPFAVKDNIDVAGRPTTAACPGYGREASVSASAVVALERAGAVLIGKTNLDQFATGLVGTRSPYGVPRNPHAPDHIPGGSSSGSAVAVARGLVNFALGTDTAGSGRVPAAMTGTFGLKPTRGIVSTHGVVPACRSLDCVSVFTRNADDAEAVLDVLDVHDPEDGFARRPGERSLRAADDVGALRVGIPATLDVDDPLADAFTEHAARLQTLGMHTVAIDFAPFLRAGELLYEGPWLAERLAGIGAFVAAHPDAVLDVTRGVLEGGRHFTAIDAFRANDELTTLRRASEAVFAGVDLLAVPSVPSLPTLAEVASDPLGTNARLGLFTNFVNLLDLAAVAVPAGRLAGVPVGITLLGPALTERSLLAVARAFHAAPGTPPRAALPAPAPGTIHLGVVGAHLRGQPLHHQLVAAGARLVARTTTAPHYRLYALSDQVPPKPGLVDDPDGASIEVEVYELPAVQAQVLRAATRPPMSIGPLTLADGNVIEGYRADAAAATSAQDITPYGGWRAYLDADK